MVQQFIDTTLGAGDTAKAGGDKINANFSEVYRRALMGLRSTKTGISTAATLPTMSTTQTGTSGISGAVAVANNNAGITWGAVSHTNGANNGLAYRNAANTAQNSICSIYFDTDAEDFEIDVTSYTSNSKHAVFVDGEFVTTLTNATNQRYLHRFTYATVKRRQVLVIGPGGSTNSSFNGVNVKPTGTVFKTDPGSSDWMFVGDSMTNGTGGPSAQFGAGSFAQVAAVQLGLQNFKMSAISGSGYLSASQATLRARQADEVIAPAPKNVVIALGFNDTSFTDAQWNAELALTYDGLQAGLPNSNFFVCGVINGGTTGNTKSALIQAAIVGRPNFKFIDMNTWITGTGRVGATTGSGNRDLIISNDDIHPSPYGHDYLGNRLAQWLLDNARTPIQ